MSGVCAVYQIRNVQNGRIYVGGTIDTAMRWRAHRTTLKRGKSPARRLQSDFWAMGLDAFRFEILEIVENAEDLRQVEQSYIDRLRPFDPDVGYNTHTDAQSPAGITRSVEHRRRLSRSLTGQVFTDARRAAISASRKSSPDAQTAIAAHNRSKRLLSEDDILQIPVMYGEGQSAQRIADVFGVSRRVIRAILAGETYTDITGIRPQP